MVKCTKGQVRWLKTALRWNGDPQRRQRIQMVLLRESGMTQPAIAEAMGVSLSTVNRACQSSRERDAIYTYLTAVFELVAWWAAERCAIERAHKALRLRHIIPFDQEEPFAAIIRCTADPAKVDKRTRSKWARALGFRDIQVAL